MALRYLHVQVGRRHCAIPVDVVDEVLRPGAIEPVPGAPAFVLGASLVRGEAIPVVDLGMLLGDGPLVDPGRLVAVRATPTRTVGLCVSKVIGFVTEDETPALQPLLSAADGGMVSMLSARDGALLTVLAASQLFREDSA